MTQDEVPIVSPEAQELRDQCAQLASELADLLTEKDHLAETVYDSPSPRERPL